MFDADPEGEAKSDYEGDAPEQPLPETPHVPPSGSADCCAKHERGCEGQSSSHSKYPIHGGRRLIPLRETGATTLRYPLAAYF
jgi:hypothetical protein